MYIIIGMASLFAGMIGIWVIYMICQSDNLKKRNGRYVFGKKINCKEIWGRPIRYIVEVEYLLDDDIRVGKIITTDKKIKGYEDNGQIRLLYVDRIDKVFWAEDSSHEKLVYVILLIVFCIFMLILSGVFFVLA